ncbi:nucleotidyl transferase AbiEii/AbiGii toxin family protein [Candidatus Micrarchaeota archaeon]|nr:nucleotidyl transferase AbiEii/AbiGii toxin family protein [Candidatus Micrarchaeota archaeon]MBU2476315.1 nucleotidyl transferase AbiEii/AbiGii toxin family protein [Candidatus Micrarchaeota archaeon]
MDEIKKLSESEFKDLAVLLKFNPIFLAKDYYLTLVLYLIRNINRIYFKGGTALQKIFLNYSRLSEDIDFTVTKDISIVKQEIISALQESGFFERITEDKTVEDFTRLVVHYTGFNGEKEKVFIDLNKRAKLFLLPEKHEIKHFYNEFIPSFSLNTLAKKELIAEKVSAAITRNKPRDHFDVYEIIQAKQEIDFEIVRKKCRQSKKEFDITRMFNNANKLKNRWDKDLIPLIAKEVSFHQVITSFAKHFNLKQEKKKKRQIKGN